MTSTPRVVDPDSLAFLDELVEQKASSIEPGLVVGVIRAGELVYQRAVGLADLERNVPLTTRSVFNIASTSKQFTALSILLLAQDGTLTLDDDVRRFIPELPRWEHSITLRNLLHHTSGIHDYILLLLGAGNSLSDALGDDAALAMLTRQRQPEFPAGAQFTYSNSNYFLLSIVVLRATGTPLAEFARRRIFEPLAMHETLIRVDHARLVPSRALSFERQSDGTFALADDNWEHSGDGSVFTTLHDLAKWDRNFHSGEVGGLDAIRQLTTAGRLTSGKLTDYALGLVVDTHRGFPIVSHGGGWAGYRSELLRFPAQRLSVIVLCNRADAEPERWARQIAERLLSAELVETLPSASEPVDEPPVDDGELGALLGTYVDESRGEMLRYTAIAGKLALAAGDEPIILKRVGERIYRIAEEPRAGIDRFEPSSGASTRVRVVDPEDESNEYFLGDRVTPHEALDPAELAGRYHSEELDATYVFVAIGAGLGLRVRDRAASPCEQIGRDLFVVPEGLIRFERDERRCVPSMLWMLRGGGIRFDRAR